MEAIEKHIEVNRPIEEVFDVATCLKRCMVWRGPIIAAEKLTDEPVGVGSEYRHRVQFLGVTVEANPVITVWEPPRRSEFRNEKGPVVYEAKFTFEPTANGTLFTSVIEAEIQGVFRHIPDRLFLRAISRQHESDLQSLKELLESDTPISA